MAEIKKIKRLNQIARELNVGIEHLIEHLQNNSIEVEARPNAKVSAEGYELLLKKFSSDKLVKEESEKLLRQKKEREESVEENPEELIEDGVEEIVFDNEKIVEEKENKITEKDKSEEVKKVEVSMPVEEEKKSKKTADKAEKKETEKTATKKVEKKKEDVVVEKKETEKEENAIKIKGKIDLDKINTKTKPDKKTAKERKEEREKRKLATIEANEKALIEKQKAEKEQIKIEAEKIEAEKILEEKRKIEAEEKNFIKTEVKQLTGPKVVGKIVIEEKKKKDPKAAKDNKNASIESRRKKRRKRIRKPVNAAAGAVAEKTKQTSKNRRYKKKEEVSQEDVQKQVRDTLAKLTNKSKKTSVKHRRKKREEVQQHIQEEIQLQEKEKSILKVTEFISANELSKLMDISVNEVIKTSFDLGKMVTINSRLDAEVIGIIAEEYGFEIQFISATEGEDIDTFVDKEEDLESRPPIVTVMGHVDHGKTSLLDFIRDANVIAGEAGGITQHIGAYSVVIKGGKRITFLDTPGHEAFTAMRARGAKVTDIAIIIVAADDNIMPQTEEAISHAKAADVPIVFAINKIDKPGADPERIKQELAEKNLLIEEWGGKYQSANISAKHGTNVDKLMEEVVLASEMLELRANPNRPAKGTIIEAELDKGRGYISTILVQTGTLKIGDILLAGAHSGKIKAMYDERNNKVQEAGPSTPVQILGLDGAPQAGETFYVMKSEKEAREIAIKNKRILREQTFRTHKHITLDEIGRRLQLGNFQEINIIIKGDVIGSVEAIADSLVKLGTDEIQIKVIHKGVGQISEADVMLAAASDAIIVGFQVRPALAAKKLAEKEEVDIRLYSIIYQAIEELKLAMEGMLSPEIKEEITATVEVREVFKVSKSGKVAGCFVLDGKIHRDDKIRLIREGIVKYQGELGSLRRFKDEAKEVVSGMECGLNIENFNDIKVGDIVESYRETETARKL
ncbi:MAG: translation initiation factor IF-2 [Bacteroidales bacterium]|nr:translation initiation factor IF-2 [Bacteroidales bacterium]